MPDPDEVPGGDLLDDYLAAVARAEPGALAATAVRTGSVGVRELLTRAAVGPGVTLDELLAAARSADGRFFRARRRQLRPAALAELARVICLQDARPGDLGDALAVYDSLLATVGPFRIPRVDQGLHAQLAHVTARPDRVAALLRRYPLMPVDVRAGLRLDRANPFLGGDGRRWWRAFMRLLPPGGLQLSGGDVAGDDLATGDVAARDGPLPFDRLTGHVAPVTGGPTISVIVTAYRPDHGLLTAVRSLLAQSWQDVEILVVDDASPPGYASVLEACARLDPRVSVLRLARNGGTYVARNVGLDTVSGDFVTFQDSDDWSHPLRLERQVRPLLAGEGTVASTSEGIPVTDRLAVTRLGHLRHARLNPSSLMIRRAAVRRRVGYFDEVRRGADSEMIERIAAAFGGDAVRHLDAAPLALIRLSPGSLSRGEVRAGWLHPARAAYLGAYRRWHDRIAAGQASPYRPRSAQDRPFAAPGHVLGANGPEYDVVFLTDWTVAGGSQRAAIEEMLALSAAGYRVAAAHLADVRAPQRARVPLDPFIQDLVNNGTIAQAHLADDLAAALIVVRHPAILQFAGGAAARLRAHRVLIVADSAPSGPGGRHYVPADCERVARELFGAETVWCPQDAANRSALLAHDGGLRVTPFDLPEVLDAAGWPTERPERSSGPPVIGADLGETAAEILLCAWPDGSGADLRLRWSGPPAGTHPQLPADWLVYDRADVSPRDYAGQLDFFVHRPAAGGVASSCRSVWEALATGCVAVLPPDLAATYGDAAVYCATADIRATVERLHADPQRYAARSRAARAAVAQRCGRRHYVERIRVLLGAPAPAAPRQRTTGR